MKLAKQAVEKMTPEEQMEAILLLEAMRLPRLARVPLNSPEPIVDASIADRFRKEEKRRAALTEEERAAEDAQEKRDEQELLAWHEGPGRDVQVHPIVAARIRSACFDRYGTPWSPKLRPNMVVPKVEPVAPAPRVEPQTVAVQPEPQPVPAPPSHLAGRRALHVAERGGEVFVAVHGGPIDHELRVPQRAASEQEQRNMMDDDEINRREKAYREQHIPGGFWGT